MSYISVILAKKYLYLRKESTMRPKKLLLALVFICIASSVLFAADSDNRQKIYPVDSDVFEAITYLYLDQGLALPSTSGPWSEAELLGMLTKIDSEKLSEGMGEAYGYAMGILDTQPKIQAKGVDFSWNFDATLESYYHTNTDEFVGRDTWIRGFIDQKPLLAVSLETWPSTGFYGYSEFTVGNTNTLGGSGDGLGFGSTALSSNIILVPPAVMMDLDFNMPYRAFVAAGGDHWTMQLGRDRMSWGAGESGNLMLGDNLKYHNMGRFTAYGDKFKYTFVTSFFPHSSAYMKGISYDEDGNLLYDPTNANPMEGDDQFDAVSGLNLFMSHRLEWRMFRDKVGLAVTESIMYQSDDNTFDLRFLNPAMIYHDYYIRANANSLLGIDIDFTPIKGLNIYAQAVVDEFSLPGEPVPSATEVNYPVTFGYLGGVKAVFPVEGLVGHASLEFAYTDPFLYLRDESKSGASATDPDTYHLNYVGVIREFTNKTGMRYNAEFLGYKYGGDAIVINLNGGVKKFGKWNVDLNGFYMMHGTFDIYTAWSRIGGSSGVSYEISTPTTDHPTVNYNDSTAQATRDSVSHTVVVGASGAYQVAEGLRAFGQLDYININNYGNIEGQKESDVQLTLGITYSL